MPIYEYQCTRCGKIYEVFQSTNDAPMTKCKQCLGEVTKLISNCSFQLKGTGWYLTDYARKNTCAGNGGKQSEGKSAEKKASENGGTKKEEAKNS